MVTLGTGCGGGGGGVEVSSTTETPMALSSTAASLTESLVQSESGQLSMTVYWVPPTLNDDGSLLTDLEGFVVLLGSQRGVYDRAIPVDNPKASQHSVESLVAGQYYVAVKAVNRDGVESMVSAEVARWIQ
jgi:hypothetical protein